MESWVNTAVPKTNFFNDGRRGFVLEYPENSNAMKNQINAVDGKRRKVQNDAEKNVKSIFESELNVSAFSDVSEINENLLPRDTYEILERLKENYRCSTFVDKKLYGKNMKNLVEEAKQNSEEICSDTYKKKVGKTIRNIKGEYEAMKDEWNKKGMDWLEEKKTPLVKQISKEIVRIENIVEEAASHDWEK